MLNVFNISHIITTYGYLGIFIIVFLESGIFFALPGDSLLFTAGLFASAYSLNIFILIALIFLATFLGGLAGYQIGENLIKFRRFSFFSKILKQEHVDRAYKFFDQYGKFAIIVSRFIVIVRTFLPIVAGMVRMPRKSFIKYSLISSLLWSTVMTLLGYFLGQVFPQIKDYIMWIVIFVVIVSILPVIYELMRRKS